MDLLSNEEALGQHNRGQLPLPDSNLGDFIMTYDDAKFNADVMVKIVRHNLVTGGNGKMAYDACEPEAQCLVRCQLTHGEKRALGLVADDEPDPIEMALRVRTREREEARFGKQYDVSRRLITAQAKMYYDALVAA